MGTLAEELPARWSQRSNVVPERISFDAVQELWTDLPRDGARWATAKPASGQAAVSDGFALESRSSALRLSEASAQFSPCGTPSLTDALTSRTKEIGRLLVLRTRSPVRRSDVC